MPIKKTPLAEMFPKTMASLSGGAHDLLVGHRYQHKKTGGTYRVMCVARIEVTTELAVVYESEKDQTKWVRPLHEFVDGRFVEIDET